MSAGTLGGQDPRVGREFRIDTREETWGFKPADVEEWIDARFHRPLAGVLARALLPTPITPNQLTVASGALGLGSGVAVALEAPRVAAALLLSGVVLDCADGQLARLRGTSSLAGRILDGLVDGVTPIAVLSALSWRLSLRFDHAWPWALALVAGLSLGWHASLYDRIKNVYLAGAHPDVDLGGGTLRAIDDLEAHQRDARRRGDRATAILLGVWRAWTAPQRRALAPWLAEGALPLTEGERARFVARFRPVMHAATWLGFGTHLFLLEGALVASAWHPEAPLWALATMAIPLNLLGLSVTRRMTRQRAAWLGGRSEGGSAKNGPSPSERADVSHRSEDRPLTTSETEPDAES